MTKYSTLLYWRSSQKNVADTRFRPVADTGYLPSYDMKKPKIIIVDEHDTVIGAKDRDLLDHGKDIYRATGLWLTDKEGNILLAQRAFTKKNGPGEWGPAASGTVDEGETYESNIIKEAEEEIGLTGVTFTLDKKMRVQGGRNFFGQWFTACINHKPANEFHIQKDEVERVRWISPTELIQDIQHNPDTYIPSASSYWMQLFLQDYL